MGPMLLLPIRAVDLRGCDPLGTRLAICISHGEALGVEREKDRFRHTPLSSQCGAKPLGYIELKDTFLSVHFDLHQHLGEANLN